MFAKHKWPTSEGIFVIADKAKGFAQLGKILDFPVIIMIISVVSFVYSVCKKLNMLKKIKDNFLDAFFTADNKISLISTGNKITGNIVTGMGGFE